MVHRPTKRLQWNIANLAQVKGFKNVARLAFNMQTSRQGLYAIWNGTAKQVSLTMLTRLAHAFAASAGDWFVWKSMSSADIDCATVTEDFFLAWNIRTRMEALGLTPAKLGFRAELYSGSIDPIVEGTAQAISIDALTKLAQALETPEHPFSIGELFIWSET